MANKIKLNIGKEHVLFFFLQWTVMLSWTVMNRDVIVSNCLYLEFGEKPTPLNVNFSDFSFLVDIFYYF